MMNFHYIDQRKVYPSKCLFPILHNANQLLCFKFIDEVSQATLSMVLRRILKNNIYIFIMYIEYLYLIFF